MIRVARAVAAAFEMTSTPSIHAEDPSPELLQQTLRDASAGDERAWRRIVDWFTPRLHGFIRSHCGDPDLAAEITQSTFCTVASKIGVYVESGRFEGWIFRIAMNRLRYEMRRRKRHAAPMDSTVLTGLAPGTHDEVPVDRRRLLNALHAALVGLSPSDRTVIELRHIGGMSFRQMAEHLDEPLGTLLARHHRALRKLKEALGPGIGEEVEDLG